MKLLSLDKFAIIFEPLSAKNAKVGVVDGIGNIGDVLLYRSTRHILDEYGIQHTTVAPMVERVDQDKFDVLLLFAGGNLGYQPCTAIRKSAVDTGIPCWVLPQSAILFEEMAWEKVFLRESQSRSLMARGEIAPDLALGYDFPEPKNKKRIKHGLFLRRYGSALFSNYNAVDPAECCNTIEEYCNLASMYSSITTDRLHFAITAMGMGCEVKLLPVSYHKNIAMYNEWLQKLGCKWGDNP